MEFIPQYLLCKFAIASAKTAVINYLLVNYLGGSFNINILFYFLIL